MSPVLRRIVLVVTTGALTAVAALGVAATGPVGVDVADVLAPTTPAPPAAVDAADPSGGPGQGKGSGKGNGNGGDAGDDGDDGDAGEALGAPLPADASVVQVGAAFRSIAPRVPEGATWQTDYDACAVLAPSTLEAIGGGDLSLLDHVASTGTPWPENPDCLYMGGYGIGPMFPITTFDEVYGLGVRGMAVQDAEGDALVLVIVDGEGWFWDYASKCDDCGIKQISERMGEEFEDRPVRHRHRRDPQPHLAGLHRRLGLRARLVHAAGHGHHRGRDPYVGHRGGPRRARGRRGARPRAQPRAPRHLPRCRGAAGRVAAGPGRARRPLRRRPRP